MIPLIVDLDGTLIHSDMLHESTFLLLKSKPLSVIKLPWILFFKGKAALKQWISKNIVFDSALLPYNKDFISWLQVQSGTGRKLVLCTASDRLIAEPIAAHLGFFDEVMASDGILNLEGRHKAAALVDKFGYKGFDYAGNSIPDLHVWRHARKAILVNATSQLERDASAISQLDEVFEGLNSNMTAWFKAVRLHQWLKNLLLFIPLLAAHRLTEGEAWVSLTLAFVAFSLCASSVYIANDLLDLESDRQHPRKSKRPFASGALPVWKGAILSPVLLILSCAVASFVGGEFLQWLTVYFAITCVYSFKLKQVVLVDCMSLAVLYTLRIVAGAAAIGSVLSFWLLAFSIFLFLSLAFVKRFAELQVQLLNGRHKAHGRGYFTDDAPLIQMLGVSAGYMSALVLALYLNSPEILRLYAHPEWVWGTVLVMIFWISWLWLRAYRGQMHDDPLVFALRDTTSLAAGGIFGLCLLLGSIS